MSSRAFSFRSRIRCVRVRRLPLNSCSQKLQTAKPIFRKALRLVRSRLRLRANFGSQYFIFDFGLWPCSGQPWKKHPSAKIARCRLGTTTSGCPGRVRTLFSIRHLPPRVSRTNAHSRASGIVPELLMRDMISLRSSRVKMSAISPFQASHLGFCRLLVYATGHPKSLTLTCALTAIPHRGRRFSR